MSEIKVGLDPTPLIERLHVAYPMMLQTDRALYRQLMRWRRNAAEGRIVPHRTLDWYCVKKLGLHPMEVFGDAWISDVIALDPVGLSA